MKKQEIQKLFDLVEDCKFKLDCIENPDDINFNGDIYQDYVKTLMSFSKSHKVVLIVLGMIDNIEEILLKKIEL